MLISKSRYFPYQANIYWHGSPLQIFEGFSDPMQKLFSHVPWKFLWRNFAQQGTSGLVLIIRQINSTQRRAPLFLSAVFIRKYQIPGHLWVSTYCPPNKLNSIKSQGTSYPQKNIKSQGTSYPQKNIKSQGTSGSHSRECGRGDRAWLGAAGELLNPGYFYI